MGLWSAVPLLIITCIISEGCLAGSSGGQAAPPVTPGGTQGTMVIIPDVEGEYPTT